MARIILSLILCLPLALVASTTNRYEAISKHYLAQFPETLQPLDMQNKSNIPTLTRQEVRRLAVELLQTHENTHHLFGETTTSPEVWKNLNLFSSDDTTFAHTIAGSLNRTQTITGEVTFAALLTQQTTDVVSLQQRQELLRLLVNNDELRQRIRRLLHTFAKVEPTLLNLSQRSDPLYDRNITFAHYDFPVENEVSWIYKNKYIQEMLKAFGEGVNGTFTLALTVVPALMLYHLCTGGITNLARTLGMSATRTYTTLAAFIMMAYFMLPDIKKMHDLRLCTFQYLRTRFADIVCMLNTLNALNTLQSSLPLSTLWPTKQRTPSPDLHSLLKLMQDSSIQSSSYFFSRGGPTLAALPLLKKVRVELFSCLQFIGLLDAYTGVAELIRAHRDTPGTFCFVDFVASEAPVIDLQGFWHPQLNAEKVVVNDVALGDASRNLVITGPNAAGKSTALKAIALNIALGQSFGIAAAQKARMTPFHRLNTYLNITDDLAKGHSLFKAELYRAKHLIDEARTLPSGQFCFTIMDEILRSTNPLEGEAGAFSIARYLGELPNSVLLLATHFPTLPSLAALPESSFRAYKVDATVEADGSISYPYTFTPGANLVNIALAMLRNEGFSPALVTEAEAILRGDI